MTAYTVSENKIVCKCRAKEHVCLVGGDFVAVWSVHSWLLRSPMLQVFYTPAGGGGACDDPFNDTALQPATCEFGLDLCLKFEGTWKQPGMNTVYALHRINVHSGIKSIQYRAV